MSALFDIRNLTVDVPLESGLLGMVSFAQPRLNILAGVSLQIGAGETLGIVGESGSGKTTLALSMLGLTASSGGEMRFDGAPLGSRASFGTLRQKTAMMFQDPVASLSPRMSVGALLYEPFIIHGKRVANRRAKVIALLEQVGLPPEIATRFPHELSGGQARRVCVARALALNPRLLVADEPTAGLDVSVQGEVLNLMAGLKTALGLSVLIISHNLAMLRHVTDRLAILYLGRLVESGPTDAIFANPRHPYTASLIAAEPQPDPRKRRTDLALKGEIPSLFLRPKGCEFHTRCAHAQPMCQTTAPELRTTGEGQVRCHFAETLKLNNRSEPNGMEN